VKVLGLVVSDKKIFENCILKTYFLTLWPTYATNWNGLNNFNRGPPRDHSCKFWSKSNERFQRRSCLSKKSLRTTHDAHRTTDDGQRPITIAHLEHFVLRWAKNVDRVSMCTCEVCVLANCEPDLHVKSHLGVKGVSSLPFCEHLFPLSHF